MSKAPFSGRCFVAHRRVAVWWMLLCSLLLAAVGCSAEMLLDPPRAATQTAQAVLASTTEALPIATPIKADPIVPKRTAAPATVEVDIEAVVPPLVVWVNEISAEHRAAAVTIGAAFEASVGRPVLFQFVDPLQVGELAEAALANGQLPDLILHNREQTGALLAAQILDVETATAIAADLDLTTVANQLYPLPDNHVAALPSDGFPYLLFYRADWLGSDFAAPDSFVNIESIARTFYNIADEERPEEIKPIAGIAVPTEQDLPSTQRIFEWLALANGCNLVDEKGEVLLTQPVCLATLEYYYNLIFNYSPPDFQTEHTVARAYVDGRTAIMIGTPADLLTIAGVNDDLPPTCAECLDNSRYLAANTGIVTHLVGSFEGAAPVNMAHARLLGITVGADTAAAAFAKFWFTDGYADWLAVEPERKVPFYTPALSVWEQLPATGSDRSLIELMPAAAADLLDERLATAPRWGITQGHGRLLSETYAGTPQLAPLVLRFLGGLITVEQSAQELSDAVTDTIPLYQFYPTPTPEPTEKP